MVNLNVLIFQNIISNTCDYPSHFENVISVINTPVKFWAASDENVLS